MAGKCDLACADAGTVEDYALALAFNSMITVDYGLHINVI